jgi:uncharacterized membrane protein YkoI
MSKNQLFAVVLALSATCLAANARADLKASTATTQGQRGSSQDGEESNWHLLERFRAAKLSLAEAIAIAEQLHPGSRTASVSFELSASPSYRVLTVKNKETWEDVIDVDTGSAAAQVSR